MLQLQRTHAERVAEARSLVTTENIYNVDTVLDASKRFKLSLHPAGTMADLRADFINLKAGNSYEILVNPTVLQVLGDEPPFVGAIAAYLRLRLGI